MPMLFDGDDEADAEVAAGAFCAGGAGAGAFWAENNGTRTRDEETRRNFTDVPPLRFIVCSIRRKFYCCKYQSSDERCRR
jgi:hypothetical protein